MTKKSSRNVRVLMTFGDDSLGIDGNPYPSLLLRSLTPDIQATTFTWRRALLSKYDLLHVHWPEHLLAGRGRRIRRACMWLLLVRLVVLGTPVVRTVHNVEAHVGLGGLDRRLSEALERRVTVYIDMNSSTRDSHLVDRRSFLIPHGHYRDADEDTPDAVLELGKRYILYFGPIHDYKGVDDLITSFRKSSIREPLHIQGAMKTTRFDPSALAESDSRITIDTHHVSKQRLAQLVDGSSVVVLPYSKLDNSGSAIYALSRNRPVIVPRNIATLELQEEFGENWIIVYDGQLTAESLEAAILQVKSLPRPTVLPMPSREWPQIGASTSAIYRALVHETESL